MPRLRTLKHRKKILSHMIALYCRNHHHPAGLLCDECSDLYAYAVKKLENCPAQKDAGFCSSCVIHCYEPERRDAIRKVMRFSGPRMLFRHPLSAFSHLLHTLRHRRHS